MKTLLVRPVLVESKERTDLWSYKGRKLYYNQANFNDEDETAYYRVVLVSLDPNDKIEVGDTGFINVGGGTIGLISYDEYYNTWDLTTKDNIHYPFSSKEYITKVIVTQDQLSPELVNRLVDEYNNGEMQTFEIEMDWVLGNEEDENQNLIPALQPKLTNNFITIVEKEHNIPYPEEPIEEDGELVYLEESTETNSDAFDRGFVAGENAVRERLESVLYSAEDVNCLLHKYLDDHQGLNTQQNHAILDVWFNENKKK